MIVILFFFVGAAFGAFRAKRRGGNRLDMAQYGATYAMILAVIGLFITIFIGRMG